MKREIRLIINYFDYSIGNTNKVRTVIKEFPTLDEARTYLDIFMEQHGHLTPAQYGFYDTYTGSALPDPKKKIARTDRGWEFI